MHFELAGDDEFRIDPAEFDDWLAQWPKARRYNVLLASSPGRGSARPSSTAA